MEDLCDIPSVSDTNDTIRFMRGVLRLSEKNHYSLIILDQSNTFPVMDLLFSWLVMTATPLLVTFEITSIIHFIRLVLPYWRHSSHYLVHGRGSNNFKDKIRLILNKVELNPALYQEAIRSFGKDVYAILESALLTATEHKFHLHTIVVCSLLDMLAMEDVICSQKHLVLVDFGLNKKGLITTRGLEKISQFARKTVLLSA